jgi:hypothetical protein
MISVRNLNRPLLYLGLLSLVTVSCRTTQPSNSSQTKDVESVKKLNWVAGSLPTGVQIAVIKCANGWADASSGGQSEFAVPYQEVSGLTFDQLNGRYCLQRIPITGDGTPNGPIQPPNGGSAVAMGYYRNTASQANGCRLLFVTPKTFNGQLKSVATTCVNGNATQEFFCKYENSCISSTNEGLSLFDGAFDIVWSGGKQSFKFVGTTLPDEFASKKIEVKGLAVSGTFEQYNSSKAMQTWQDACNKLKDVFTKASGAERVESFSCGTPRNFVITDGFYLYYSEPNATVVLSGAAPKSVAGTLITGENKQFIQPSLNSWNEACLAAISQAAAQYGTRFVAFACGIPKDVVEGDWYQFQSQPTVWFQPIQ